MTPCKKTKKIVKIILNELNKLPPTLESLQKLTLKYFGGNIFAEFEINNSFQRMTYNEMFVRSNNVRNNLLNRYLNQNGTVVLQMENSPNWYIAFWGIVSAGFKPILVNPKIDKLDEILRGIKVITIIDDKNIKDFLMETTQHSNVEYAKEIAFLSSGTTGIPKVISHDVASLKFQIATASEILKQSQSIRLGNKLSDADKIKILVFLPLYHIFGFMVIVIWLSFFGRTVVFLEKLTSECIQKTCKKHKVTHFFAVPLVWESAVNSIIQEAKKLNQYKKLQRAIKLSNFLQNIAPKMGNKIACNIFFKKVRQQVFGTDLKFLISGGAQINTKYLKFLNGIGYSIHNGYGLTESGIVSVELSKYPKYRNLPSVGKPFKLVNWQVTKQKELQIKTPLLFKNQILNGKLIENDKNNWYSTNDIVKIKKGRIQIVGRLDDVIIGRDGENVSPEELENLFSISDLYTCAILGIKQRSGSHQINLLIHFQNNVSEEERTKLINKINQIVESIPLYKRPIKFYAVNFLPLTNLGKVKHKELTDLYQKHKLELVPLTENTENNLNLIKDEKTKLLLLEVRKCFAKIFNKNIEDIYDNTNFITDLGGSSIDYYGLLNEVSFVTKKEIILSEHNILLTPLDFVAYIIKN